MNFRRINLFLAFVAMVFSPAVIVYDDFWTVLLFPLVFLGTYFALNLLFWVTVLAVSLTANPNKKYSRPSRFYGFVFNSAFYAICNAAGVRIDISGLEKVPKEPFLLVANHRSKFDNMILSAVLQRTDLLFVSKPENFKIPIGKRLMARCCYQSIDRENPRNAMVTVNESASLISEHGASVGIFPEGRRGKGPGVDKFSDGCFLIAKKGGCGVLVATLKCTEMIHKNFPFRTTDVRLEFLSAIPYTEIADKRSGEISAYVHAIMQSNLLNEGSNGDEIRNVQPSCE